MRGIAVLACLAALCALGCGSLGGGEAGGQAAEDRSVAVTVVPAVVDDVVFSSTKIGVVKVNRQVSINFAAPGRLEQFMAEEDQYVREGEPIARLDEIELKAALQTTRIQLRDLESKKEKLDRLLKKQMVTEAEYDQVKTAWLACKEQLTVAEDRLAKVVVAAPFSGVLLKKLAERGSFVPPGAPVAVLVDIDKVRVEFDFSDREIQKVQVGGPVDVVADAFPGKTFKGTIARVVPSVDSRSRMTLVEIVVDNPERHLRPGMMVRSDVVVGSWKKVVSIPVDCLVYQGARTFVYVVDSASNCAYRRDVELGPLYRERAVVTKGLTEGALVVETGQSYLSEGAPCKILK